ncbi:TetR/AcrR family transcriptional regulator C-terminal domain-containing protein [Nocardia sp. NBC_01327]|uniref:TetR/AcrR family transcriptional regulator C-terminal domain-containing protein n=1 Tax=Nocardia sp. NBC_01327 TaxID=2903593 RepID=UPI002E13F70E|nr:TetR/AcrR family transcriptional regulator C-terminal domain-containing protein [Nocardia sp. NBC_01327]
MNAPSERAKPGRPAQFSREDVVLAAVAVLDAEGLEALTMRRIGAQLNVSAMALYRHLPNRQAVLAAIVDHLVAQTDTTMAPGVTWPLALHTLAGNYRRMLLSHPNAVVLLATHPVDIEIGTHLVSDVLILLMAEGITQQDALTTIQSVMTFVLGHALAQAGTPPGSDEPTPAADAEFYDHWFTTGLDAFVTGFEQKLGSAN